MEYTIFEKIAWCILWLILTIILIGFSILMYDLITWKSCYDTYTPKTEYSVFGGCKIEYEWVMIPKELYTKQWEQNLNIN